MVQCTHLHLVYCKCPWKQICNFSTFVLTKIDRMMAILIFFFLTNTINNLELFSKNNTCNNKNKQTNKQTNKLLSINVI